MTQHEQRIIKDIIKQIETIREKSPSRAVYVKGEAISSVSTELQKVEMQLQKLVANE